MSTATVPLDQHPDAACREVALRVINNVMPAYAAGLHAGSDAYVQHEHERWEAMPHSPLSTAMNALIDGERQWRRLHGSEGNQ